MVKWSCASALCFNNYTSRDKEGRPLKYYRLPRDVKLQTEYSRIFKTSGINWKKGHICSAHWSSNESKDTTHLPDIAVPSDQLLKLELKYQNAKTRYNKASNPTDAQKLTLKKSKRKYETAVQLNESFNSRRERPKIVKCSTPLIKNKRSPTKFQYKKKLENSLTDVSIIQAELDAGADTGNLKTLGKNLPMSVNFGFCTSEASAIDAAGVV